MCILVSPCGFYLEFSYLLMMLSVFHVSSAIFIYIFVKVPVDIVCQIFNGLFYHWVVWVLYIIPALCYINHSICALCFHFLNWRKIFLNFDEKWLITFSLYCLQFLCTNKSLPHPRSQRFILISFGIFILLGFKFIIHFKLFFIYYPSYIMCQGFCYAFGCPICSSIVS